MMLLRALGVKTYETEGGVGITDVPAKEQDKIKNELVDAAEGFQRAGGVLTSDDWLAMSPHEKAAMIHAGNALRHEMAIEISKCVHDPQYRAALESLYDGGKALREQEYNEGLAELLAQMKRVDKAMRENVYEKP